MPSQNNVTITDIAAMQTAQTTCNCGINSNFFTTPTTTTTTTVGTSYN